MERRLTGAGWLTGVQANPAVVVFMPEINPEVMGGTMRLGQRATKIRAKAGKPAQPTLASRLYCGADGE